MVNTDDPTFRIYVGNITSAGLSLIGSFIIITNYLFYSIKSQLLYKLVFFLSLADFGGSLFICVSQAILFFPSVSEPYGLCIFLRAGINFFFVASFIWTCCTSLHMWVSAKQKAQIPIMYFHLVSWGVPAVITLFMIGGKFIDVETGTNWCHPNEIGKWAFWFAPLGVSFLFNACLYVMCWRHFSAAQTQYSGIENSPLVQTQPVKNKSQKKYLQKAKLQLSLYLFVFMVCWFWDVVNQIYTNATPGHPRPSPPWMKLLESVFSPLQGFLNFLVYGFTTRMFGFCRSKKAIPRVRSGPFGPFQNWNGLTSVHQIN